MLLIFSAQAVDFGAQAVDDFKLAAVARLKNTQGTAECIETDGDIEYWVNMATRATQTTKIIATGGMTMTELTVNGPLTVDGAVTLTGEAALTIPGALIMNGTLTTDNVLMDVFAVDASGVHNSQNLISGDLRNIILRLETRIVKLCKYSKDYNSNVCGI